MIAGARACGWLLLAMLAAPACSSSAPLGDTRPSAETLAGAVLEAYAARDLRALHALALSEEEFKAHVWPELPAARPERNLPFSYVWGDLKQKSEAGLGEALAKHGGRRYELLRVEHAGESTQYPSFLVHRDTVLVVKNAGGEEVRVRFYGSTLHKDGVFKVFSYVVD